jgi:hypothetical protein
MLHKLGNACFAIRDVKYCNDIETLRMMYHAYFHSIMKYWIVFWGNLPGAKNVILLQKTTIKIMMGVKHRSTCSPAFKMLNILTVVSQ